MAPHRGRGVRFRGSRARDPASQRDAVVWPRIRRPAVARLPRLSEWPRRRRHDRALAGRRPSRDRLATAQTSTDHQPRATLRGARGLPEQGAVLCSRGTQAPCLVPAGVTDRRRHIRRTRCLGLGRRHARAAEPSRDGHPDVLAAGGLDARCRGCRAPDGTPPGDRLVAARARTRAGPGAARRPPSYRSRSQPARRPRRDLHTGGSVGGATPRAAGSGLQRHVDRCRDRTDTGGAGDGRDIHDASPWRLVAPDLGRGGVGWRGRHERALD